MSTQYIDAVLRLIDKFTQPMNNAMGKLNNSSRTLNKVGRSVQNVGKNLTAAGTTLTMGVTAPVVAFGTTAVKAFGDVDKTMRLVKETMSDTSEWDRLNSTMKDAAANSVFGMQDAADATLNFARQGWSAGESADMIESAMSLAAGTATDLSTVTEGLGSAMKAFGADTKDAANYTDVMAVAQGQANTTVTDLFNALSTGGAAAKTVGWSMEDLSVATGVLGDAMISGSEAGNAFKTGLARLADPPKEAVGALEKYGIELFNQDGTMKSFIETQNILHDKFSQMNDQEQMAAASAIFGKNQMTKWLTLIQRSPQDIAKMSGALAEASGNTEGEAKNMADALLKGVGGSIEKLKSSFDVLKTDLGGIMGDVVKPVIDKAAAMMDAFRKMPDESKKNIVSMVMKIAALGPALLIFGKLTTGIGGAIVAFGRIGRAVTKAGGVMALITGPAGIIIGVLAAIAAVTFLVIKNWDKVKPVVQKVAGYIGGVFSKLGVHFDYIKGQFFGFVDTVRTGVAQFLDVWSPVINFFKGTLVGVLATAFGVVSGILGAVGMMISDVFGGVLDVLSGVIDFIVGVFTLDWARAWEGVEKIFQGIAEGLAGIFKAPINAIIGIINGVVSAINGIGFDVPDWVPVIGGQKFSLNIPTIPMLAKGTNYAPGGLAIVGERGPELVNLPRGSRVYSNAESRRMAGGVSLNISKIADTVNIREDSDIDKLAAAIALQMENRFGNMVWEG